MIQSWRLESLCVLRHWNSEVHSEVFVVLVTVADCVVVVDVTELGKRPHRDELELTKSTSSNSQVTI